MTYHGYVKNGVVVLDDSVTLPEGAEVRIELCAQTPEQAPRDEKPETLAQRLLKHAGKATGLPPDAAAQHDHYLYGTPKR